ITARAMDEGIMSGRDYRGFDMEPGMMHYGGYQAHGMGSSMMGPHEENSLQRNKNRAYTDKNAAERIFDDYLNSKHNPNLKLGKIKDEGSFFEADLLSRNNSLVDKLIVDKNTGRMRSAY
ncbi:MAG: hypothetical protein PVI93_21050, partial [Desulfobacterales bacterium]